MGAASEPGAIVDATRVLTRRLRFVFIACLGPILLFALADLRLEQDRLGEFWAIKLAAVAVLAAAIALLRTARTRRFVIAVGLGAVALLYVLSSASAILAREPFTTPLLSISVAIGTATLLPWGALPQLAVAVIAALATVVTAQLSTGSLWTLVAYPNVGVAIGLGMSVYVAYELDRSRRILTQYGLQRRRAEDDVRRLNVELERRVAQRTAQIAGFNRELEDEVARRRKTQAELRALIENVGEGIWSVDPSYRVIAFNAVMAERYRQLFGRPLSLGERMEAWVPPNWRARWERLYDRALAGERFTLEEEIAMPGGTRWYAISFNPIVSDAAVTGVTVFSSDITDRKLADEAERRHQAELAHVLRLSTMGEMAAGLAHEINQPLAAIVNFARGCSHRLREGTRSLGELVEAVDAIAAEALRAGEIIRRMRQMVRKGQPREELVDLDETVRDVVQLLQPDIRQFGIAVELRRGDAFPLVLGDRIQIEQIVMNLLRNAIDAMAQTNAPRRLLLAWAAVDSSHVELTVEDSGPGLSAAAIEHLFERFYTTKASGLGMGLSISRTLAEAHGGRLSAEPCASGARFRLILPAAPGPVAGDADVAAEIAAP
jgi:PAS domain S-box-containing protein